PCSAQLQHLHSFPTRRSSDLHRGFNTEAVKRSIAENIRAGAYRRGAGTITMQLARNLWLGHERTLSRKMQEVVLAWILEHLTGVDRKSTRLNSSHLGISYAVF